MMTASKQRNAIPWRRAGVMGLGLSGLAAAGFLARRGVAVMAADDRTRDELMLRPGVAREIEDLEAAGVQMRLGPSSPEVFADCDAVIASPGVSPVAAPLASAAARGIPVLAEVELAARFLRGVLIGITGSNGKSTVTSLTGCILKEAGIPSSVCGNIGTPLTRIAEADLDLPEEKARAMRYVVELSSFQLEGIETLHPHIAVLLNLSPDHQDRYRSSDDYYAAKGRIFMNQSPEDVAIVNEDDAAAQMLARRTAARRFPFSATQDLPQGALRRGDDLMLRRGRGDEPFMKVTDVPMPGRHNVENVLACAAAAAHCGAGPGEIARAVAAYAPLPHRLEPVGTIDGITYVNDSKATNVGAALGALSAFEEPVVLLLGGYDKGGDFEELRAPLQRPGRVRGLVTFGAAGPAIARLLRGAAPAAEASDLSDAVRRARAMARTGDVVLLAPACASYDAYNNFEERGEDFRNIVRALLSGPGRAS